MSLEEQEEFEYEPEARKSNGAALGLVIVCLVVYGLLSFVRDVANLIDAVVR